MPGENLDLTSDPEGLPTLPQAAGRGGEPGKPRSFVGIHFACCDAYARVYVNREGTAYVGYCPRCSKPVRLRIGPGGTDSRFFTAY